MASSQYSSTEETTNANRACRLLLGPCTDELRDVLRNKVHSPTLTNVIKRNFNTGNSPRLSPPQRNLVLPNHGKYTGNYNDMDISLLYTLLRNICTLPPPSNGWNEEPDPSDTSVSANIERIHQARNKCGHASSSSLSNTEFNSIWSTLRSAVQDLDTAFSNNYLEGLDFLRHETMDPVRDRHYQEELRKQYEEDQKTREMVVKLEKKVDENTKKITKTEERVQEISVDVKSLKQSPIPANVKDQHNIKLKEWKDEDSKYQETHSFPSMMEKIKNQGFVTFVGVSGSGKSATAHHIALKLAEEGYEVVPIKDIRKIEDYCDTRNPQVFVIDDVVGVHGLEKTKLDLFIEYEENITNPRMENSITLMTCREVVFNEALSYKPFFTKKRNVIKMHDPENALNENDKKRILQKHGLDVELLSPSLLALVSRMFPVLCKLYSREAEFRSFGSKFFISPVPCILDKFDEMQMQKKLDYASLVLCMMNGGLISKDILKDKKNELFINIKSDVLENCKLESGTDSFKFVDALSAMEGTYTKQSGSEYTFIHDSIFEICAYHYGQQFPQQMLKYMNSSYIANYVKPKKSEACNVRSEDSNSDQSDERCNQHDDKSNEREESFDLCIRLREDQYPLLAERLYRDIERLELYDVFKNDALKNPQVCQAFIEVLKGKRYVDIKSLFLDEIDAEKLWSMLQQENNKQQRNKTFRHADILMVTIYTRSGVIILKTLRVISWVIYYGHHQILQYIIEQTEKQRETQYAMFYKDRAQSVLQEEKRLFLLGCLSGDVETVKVLLQYISKDFINVADTSIGLLTPLVGACEEGHVSIVEELIKIGADVNLGSAFDTPLTAACSHGHENIVKVLLKAKADVNLGSEFDTPLTAACRQGHESIVKRLLQAEAGVNLPSKDSDAPLTVACRHGHESIVKELLQAKADVNLGSKLDTPLTAACRQGHESIVKRLLQAEADINLRSKDTNTPLTAACIHGHESIVKELIQAGADVNLGSKFDTPMSAACERGHLSVVKELLHLTKCGAYCVKKVDLYVSALFVGLAMNKIDVVHDLLQSEEFKTNDGNLHLFNVLVDIRSADVKTDSKDDVIEKGRQVRHMEMFGHWWKAIIRGECGVLRHLLSVGLDKDQLILYDRKSKVRPLLHTLIDEYDVKNRVEKVRILLEAGADVNIRAEQRKHFSFGKWNSREAVLDTEGISVLERTKRICTWNRDSLRRFITYKGVMSEIKKNVRRYSV